MISIVSKWKEEKMYIIDNKFELEEECWSVYRERIIYQCPICKGKTEIASYKGYKIPCPACDGKGFYESSKYALTHCKVKIRRVISSIGENEVNIRYNVEPIGKNWININVKHRNESMLFKTEEEAESFCIAVNKKEISSEF